MVRLPAHVPPRHLPFTPAAGRLLLCGALMFGALVSAVAPAAQSTSDHVQPAETTQHASVLPGTGR